MRIILNVIEKSIFCDIFSKNQILHNISNIFFFTFVVIFITFAVCLLFGLFISSKNLFFALYLEKDKFVSWDTHQLGLYKIFLVFYPKISRSRSSSPMSKPQIPKSQIQRGKEEFGLWAVPKILSATINELWIFLKNPFPIKHYWETQITLIRGTPPFTLTWGDSLLRGTWVLHCSKACPYWPQD